MKVKSTITNLTKGDLVNLISTASYGSQWLDFQYDRTKCPDVRPNDCAEDIAAKILLAGETIEFVDYNAEEPDEIYSSKAHYEADAGIYPISLIDIANGLETALNGGFRNASFSEEEEARESVLNLQTGDLDNGEAETLMQIIMFNEIIY